MHGRCESTGWLFFVWRAVGTGRGYSLVYLLLLEVGDVARGMVVVFGLCLLLREFLPL